MERSRSGSRLAMGSGIEEPVYVELHGNFSIVGPFYAENLAEISRRASIIMACHLFHRIDAWDRLRPYVAAHLHRSLASIGAVSYMSSLDKHFNDSLLVAGCPIYGKAVNRYAKSDVQGYQELSVGKGVAALVKYHLSICCTLERPKTELLDFAIAPEPHYSWWDLLRTVDCAGPSKMPFVAAVDKAICAEIQRHPLSCLAER